MYPQGPLWASPSFSIWEQQQALQFDPSLFATNMPPCSDLILFTVAKVAVRWVDHVMSSKGSVE